MVFNKSSNFSTPKGCRILTEESVFWIHEILYGRNGLDFEAQLYTHLTIHEHRDRIKVTRDLSRKCL